MAAYVTLTTARLAPLDATALLAALRTATGDATAVLVPGGGVGAYIGKKAAAWSGADLSAAQALLDSGAPLLTPQVAAQREIDAMDIPTKALALALIDALNVVRAALPTPLGAITTAQAIAAIRAKAGTL